ncbi:hypothetical protein DSO57_1017355 [Entomophthora muscae]|uniref:Uncharacterized protein n=1 Tax=Entomophthora muscae TaxID=34485 RepID=A0ACC2SHK6_9FUNG|nr:hypothetical protein DSO57_1017355 [Entomophthora muscae]
MLFPKPQKLLPRQARVIQTLSAYKFKYEFVSDSLNILPNLLSCNPSMFPSNAEDNPQIALISTLSVLLPTPGLLGLLVLVPEFPLVLLGSLLHYVVST